MNKDDRLTLAQAKAHIYNNLAQHIKPFLKAYWQALKEIRSRPYTGAYNDYAVLEKYGLGKLNKYFGTKIDEYHFFQWDYDLGQVAHQLKVRL